MSQAEAVREAKEHAPRLKRRILLIAPVFQQIYAESIRIFHNARDNRDIEAMLKAFRMTYDAAPTEVKNIVNEIVARLVQSTVESLDEPGWERNAKVALHALYNVLCSQILNEYREMETMRAKRSKCFSIMDNILQRVFTEMIRALDLHGGLMHARWEMYGGDGA